MKRRGLVIVGIVVAALATISIRVVVEGRRALANGDAALADKRPLDAIAAWESAARWYLPLAPHVDEAYERLVAIARADRYVDLVAWRAVRSAALATRSLWTPHAAELEEANAQIAAITAKDPEGSLAAGKDRAERETWQRARLDRDARPALFWVAIAIAGIVSWIGGIAWLVLRPPARPRVRWAAGIALAGAAAWIAGLYNA